jgi:hypothetical protein
MEHKADLTFERRKGVQGYVDKDGNWAPATDSLAKMSKSASKEPNMIGELSLESQLKAMTSERDYWKLRHELQEKYGSSEDSLALIRVVHDETSVRVWDVKVPADNPKMSFRKCARCGGDHKDVPGFKITNSNTDHTMFAMCPTLNESVLIKVITNED